MDPLPTMLRDFARRCMQWADVLDKEYEDSGLSQGVKEVLTILNTPTVAQPSPGFVTADSIPPSRPGPLRDATSQPNPLTWRRGDYFFCTACRRNRQWFADTPPWSGALCRTCYDVELQRVERGRKV
jgi:hypothetical protein